MIKLTYGRRRGGFTKIPLAAGGARVDETILQNGVFSHGRPIGSSTRIRQTCKVWKIRDCFSVRNASGLLHHRSLDNDAECDVFPQRYQQLASQGDDGWLLPPFVVGGDALLEPQGQRRLRLVLQP